jgi:uncharacterized protein
MNQINQIPESMKQIIEEVAHRLAHRPKLSLFFKHCFPNTLQTTVKRLEDGTTFVITGDIPAMWLRDSAAQVRPYLILAAQDQEIRLMLEGVVRRQMQYILHDAYANAFNESMNGNGFKEDITAMTAWLWERKYEVDSLCYPIQLAYLLWKRTATTAHLDPTFWQAARRILEVWQTEQHHESKSTYRFQRPKGNRLDTLVRQGLGSPTAYTGMLWSGFRPSDDACSYHYLIPANIFAVVVAGYLAEMAEKVGNDPNLATTARELGATIQKGIEAFGKVVHPKFGTIYAYEVDGLGNYHLMDDANVPSLLALPYLGYCPKNEPVYQNTRRFALSKFNPYYYQGKFADGIGSPHTPPKYIWHISLIIQALTASDQSEKEKILAILERTDAGTNFMHESFLANNPAKFTRAWFAWANSLFSELVLDYVGL